MGHGGLHSSPVESWSEFVSTELGHGVIVAGSPDRRSVSPTITAHRADRVDVMSGGRSRTARCSFRMTPYYPVAASYLAGISLQARTASPSAALARIAIA